MYFVQLELTHGSEEYSIRNLLIYMYVLLARRHRIQAKLKTFDSHTTTKQILLLLKEEVESLFNIREQRTTTDHTNEHTDNYDRAIEGQTPLSHILFGRRR